jgi:hypothetical protein
MGRMQHDLFTAAVLAVMLVAISVMIHYETLHFLARRVYTPGRHRWLILGSVLGALSAHVVEIWFFGGAYWAAVELFELGHIAPAARDHFDYVYYSAMVYTTVGFGDLVPDGAIRMITSTEALLGLALITWSASFSYLQMQRVWRD